MMPVPHHDVQDEQSHLPYSYFEGGQFSVVTRSIVCTSDVVPVEEQRGLGILQSSILSKYRCARSPADCEV